MTVELAFGIREDAIEWIQRGDMCRHQEQCNAKRSSVLHDFCCMMISDVVIDQNRGI
jgi:hypothetical protein